MIGAVMRKGRRLLTDPVLRRWVAGRGLGLHRRRDFVSHRPPYLEDVALAGAPEESPQAPQLPALDVAAPTESLVLDLPGERVVVDPSCPASLFERSFADTETLLAVHRFAWLPLRGAAVEPAWVDRLWRAWAERFAEPDASWAWHPYTAAERALNILGFVRRFGVPGDRKATLSLLGRHAPAIATRLEYFGEHDTSNHLSNDGRGLYLLGLALGMPQAAEIGRRILLAEAERLFRPSGILREGSSHYHLLVTRNYAEAWLAARAAGRAEESALRTILRRALSAVPHLRLPAGMPLIGDISPDCPPAHLGGLLPSGDLTTGWGALLDDADRAALQALMGDAAPTSSDQLAADGWVRFDLTPWSGLWFAAPGGWPPMPGHAHQDMGSGEIHYRDIPLFIDPGRGRYGEDGEAGWYVSAAAHNALLVEGQDPYPANKPYYDDGFRRRVAGPPPRVTRGGDDISIAFGGFGRQAGIGEVERRFAFAPKSMAIDDRVGGTAQTRITRRLHTPHAVERIDGGAVIRTPSTSFRLTADTDLRVTEGKRWTAYGVSAPCRVIDMTGSVRLPARLHLRVERI